MKASYLGIFVFPADRSFIAVNSNPTFSKFYLIMCKFLAILILPKRSGGKKKTEK